MLTPGLIPNKEPMIRVGLILPEDNIHSIQISFSDTQCFEIETIDRSHPSFENSDQLSLRIVDGNLVIPELKIEDTVLKIIPSISDDGPFITIDGILAGRGFHWEKKISASYWGILEFCVSNGLW